MESMLGKIGDFCNSFAQVISNIADSDVIITDSNMKITGSAFKHFSLYNDIKIGSLIAEVLVNNKNVLISDKSKIESCRECERFKVCKMKGFVGVPIRYENRVLGAIALILPGFKVKALFERLDFTIEFMENMAELVAARMVSRSENKGLKKKLTGIEAVLGMMDEAVLYTDSYGNIIYLNREFIEAFGADESFIGRNISSVYPEFEIFIKENKEWDRLKTSLDLGGHVFTGAVTSKRIWLSDTEYGIVFCFESEKTAWGGWN